MAITFDDVQAAAERLNGVAHRTPVLTSQTINYRTGYEVYFKCENLQRVGAFKFRGAYNALSRLSRDAKAFGVITHSSGNHAQGVALAAKLLRIDATIVMPTDAPAAKIAATEGYGAEIVFYDRMTRDRREITAWLAEQYGYTFIPPFDHPYVMAGQGTVALELLQDVPDLEVLVAPVGGGGLLSGCAVAAKAMQPTIKIYGVETDTSNDWWQSFRENRRVRIDPPHTIADGIRTQQPGELTYPIVRELVEDILLVSDDEVIAAMIFMLQRMKILVEPSGAVALAAVLNRLTDTNPRKIGVILSGGNVDGALLGQCLANAPDS